MSLRIHRWFRRHSSHHYHTRRIDIRNFKRRADTFFQNIGDFFYVLFRPVRHFFRWLFQFFAHLFSGFNNRLTKSSAGIAENTKNAVKRSKVQKKERYLNHLAAYPSGYHLGLDQLRLILMFFLCIDLFGLPTIFGSWGQTFCGFVPLAFFILSGYLVLRESTNRSQRIVRTIKRTAITFGALLIFYFVLNLLFYRWLGINIFSAFTSKRVWFNFVVLNLWPFDIGTAIWYVQSLLYAYIIIYFLDKCKLLKFDWLIAIVLILFTIITGELCGVIRWNILGYQYIPGNFVTRALPYILLGSFMHRKIEIFNKLRPKFYGFMIPVGILLMLLEVIILDAFGVSGYYGHLFGMPVIAISVCMLGYQKADNPGFEKRLGMSRGHINIIYYLCQPVSVGLAVLLSTLDSTIFMEISDFIGIITFILCFGIAWLIAIISGKLSRSKVNE